MNVQSVGKADYSYWLTVRIWSAEEAAALLLGYEPEYANYRFNIRLATDDVPEDTNRTAISAERQKLEKVLTSAQLAGEFGKVELNQMGGVWGNTVSPSDWIAWARRNNVDCAEELLIVVAEINEQVDSDPDYIHRRRETTLLRVIGALLQELKKVTNESQASVIKTIVDQHGFKPGISKSQLENDFAAANRRLSDW